MGCWTGAVQGRTDGGGPGNFNADCGGSSRSTWPRTIRELPMAKSFRRVRNHRRQYKTPQDLRDNRGFPDEDAFQSWVIRIATLNGWRHYHTRRSDRSVKGFPDLVLIRRKYGDHVYAELKHGKNTPSKEQKEWLADLAAIGTEVHLWYPRDMADIRKRLERKGNNGV